MIGQSGKLTTRIRIAKEVDSVREPKITFKDDILFYNGKKIEPVCWDGTNRNIYYINRNIVLKRDKFPHFDYAEDCSECWSEANFYNNILNDKERQYFAEILFYGKYPTHVKNEYIYWNIMKRYYFDKTPYLNVGTPIYKKMEEIIKKYQLRDVRVSHPVFYNCGVNKTTKEVIIYDYGLYNI